MSKWDDIFIDFRTTRYSLTLLLLRTKLTVVAGIILVRAALVAGHRAPRHWRRPPRYQMAAQGFDPSIRSVPHVDRLLC